MLNKNINFENWKWKIPHTVFERQNLCFSSYKNRKLKVKLWWLGARERKKRAFFLPFILSEVNFFCYSCFISVYSPLNTLSEYTYFYISDITSYTFLLVFKIVKSFRLSLILFNALFTNMRLYFRTKCPVTKKRTQYEKRMLPKL